MRCFQFSLESVYRWKTLQSDAHEALVQLLSSRLDEALARAAELAQRQIATTRETISEPILSAHSLRAVAAHRARLDRDRSATEAHTNQIRQDLERERRAWIEVRRALRALGMVRDRQRSEYLRNSDREMETFAAEAFLAQWQQRQRK